MLHGVTEGQVHLGCLYLHSLSVHAEVWGVDDVLFAQRDRKQIN